MQEQAYEQGLYETLRQMGVKKAVVPYRDRFAEISIDEMNLSVRSTNGLKRAGALTLGKLLALLEQDNGILSVRNLGQKSAKEIKRQFFDECYIRLTAHEKTEYWKDISIDKLN